MVADMHYDKKTVLKGYYILYFKQGKLFNDLRKIPPALKTYFADVFQHSRSLQSFAVSTYKLYRDLLERQTIGVLLKSFITTLALLRKHFLIMLINFISSLILAFFAQYFFEKSLVSFFITIIPTILLFTISWELYFSYLWIHEKRRIDSISKIAVQRLLDIVSLALLHFILVIETLVLFFAIIVGNTYLFSMAGIDWGTSFLFWWITIILGMLTIIMLWYFMMLFPQSYFLVLFQKRTPLQGLIEAKSLLAQRTSVYVLGYIFVIVITTMLTIFLSTKWADAGITFSLNLLVQSIMFLGFLLWLKLSVDNTEPTAATRGIISKTFLVLVILAAVPSFLALTSTSIREYPKVASMLSQSKETNTEQMTIYEDKTYLYTINYPQSWDIYHEKDTSVTFYHNYTKTDDGGLWIRVAVSPALQEDFDKIYYSKPGIISSNEKDKIVAKITNTTLSNSKAAEYSEIVQTDSGQQFMKHYSVFRNGNIYDLSLTTTSKNTENFYGSIFDQMVATFQFSDLPTTPTP